MTILFVEDEPIVIRALIQSLEAEDFKCEVKKSATDAWKYLLSNSVTLIVTDVMMPGGELFESEDSQQTGYLFISSVRKKFPKIPIICLSVINDQNKIAELKHQGVLYLKKGETTLDTAITRIRSKATGTYSV